MIYLSSKCESFTGNKWSTDEPRQIKRNQFLQLKQPKDSAFERYIENEWCEAQRWLFGKRRLRQWTRTAWLYDTQMNGLGIVFSIKLTYCKMI